MTHINKTNSQTTQFNDTQRLQMDLSLDILLVDGFIREIRTHLIQIIPSEINTLCFAYIYIDSMQILNKTRINAQKSNDLYTVFQIEQLILFAACHDNIYITWPPYNYRIPFQQVINLKIGDNVDHRDKFHRFCAGTVKEIQGTNLKIHYIGYADKWDEWSDFETESYRFAKHESISKRTAHRFGDLEKNDNIDINPLLVHPGWKCGEIRKFNTTSGQIQVVYKIKDRKYLYWTHLDNTQEIAAAATMSTATKSASVCNGHWVFHPKLMIQVLTDWVSQKKIDEFRDIIIEYIQLCIQYDNVTILKVMLKHCGYDKIERNNCYYDERYEELFEFINHAIKYNAFGSVVLLLKCPNDLDWTNQRRPICLLTAIKCNHNNIELINFLVDKLESVERKNLFICDHIMRECIRYDLVDVAKRIIENRWHSITDLDEEHAHLVDGKCHKLFIRKANALNAYNENDELYLDDDEWGNQEEDDDFDDDGNDDDWENAMDSC